ncbi:MAG TPA: mismatch-specific DNA-glycosylase [Limnochordia bacterium]|nr:mismatch-specific DNA-glycosylase [Limnochordia bacterium]
MPDSTEDWQQARLTDILAPGLDVVFVGLNPGRRSAAASHHFAGPGNHFWRLLFEAGFTPVRLAPVDDTRLLEWQIGLTNIVDRPSRGEADLSQAELAAGGEALRRKLAPLAPRVVALLGKQVYRHYAELPASRRLDWGPQAPSRLPGALEFLAPNPSARSTIPYEARLALFRELRAATRRRAAGASEHPLAHEQKDDAGRECKGEEERA